MWCRTLVSLLIGLSLAQGLAASSAAASPFDGRWTWQVDLSGQCSSAFFEDLHISDGEIETEGRHWIGRFVLKGNVSNDGAVKMSGFASGVKISASGTLVDTQGRGDMLVTGTASCSGSWNAEKAE